MNPAISLYTLGLGVVGAAMWSAMAKRNRPLDHCLRSYVAPLITDQFLERDPKPELVAAAFGLPRSAHSAWAPGVLDRQLKRWTWRISGNTPKISPEQAARLIADAIEDGRLELDPTLLHDGRPRDIEPDEIEDLEALAKLALLAGPEQGNRLLGHIERHLDRLDELDAVLGRLEETSS